MQAISLSGRNPFGDLQWDAVRQRLVVAQAGNFGVLDGGVEFVDPGPAVPEAVRVEPNTVQQSLDAATDPASADFLNFSDGGQALVDTAFLAQGILRAPGVLWEPLDARTRQHVIAALNQLADRRQEEQHICWMNDVDQDSHG